MKRIKWNTEKNERLRNERNISFEDVEAAIEEGKIVEILEHWNQEKYPGQMILLVEINNYACVAPFYYEDNDTIFLLTVYPSRKATEKYLGR